MRRLFPLSPPAKEGEKGVPFGGFFFIPQSRESLEKLLISVEFVSIGCNRSQAVQQRYFYFPISVLPRKPSVWHTGDYFKGSQQLSH